MQLRPAQQQVMADLRTYFAQQIAINKKKRKIICSGLQQVWQKCCACQVALCMGLQGFATDVNKMQPMHSLIQTCFHFAARMPCAVALLKLRQQVDLHLAVQGTDSMKRYHSAVGTEAQKYVATIFEVYSEVSQLRDNLREQHRIWVDFYASVFKVTTTWALVFTGQLAQPHDPINSPKSIKQLGVSSNSVKIICRLVQQTHCMRRLSKLACLQVWDLVQHCQAVVHSFPRYPDIVAICKCAAESLQSGALPF